MVQGIFKIALHLRDRHVFMWQSLKILNVFNTLTLKQIFWKTKTFLKKLEYRILFESNNTENRSFPYKTAISEANVKTNKMFQFKSLLCRIDLLYQLPKIRYWHFLQALEFPLTLLFPNEYT